MRQWGTSAAADTPLMALKQWPMVIILALYVVIAGIYAVVNPSFEASDELWHYPFIKHLADGQGLPVQRADQIGPWRQEGSQPPLYYAVGALLTVGVNTSDMDAVRWLNPHADIGILKADRNANMVIHRPDERFPYHGTLLALHLVRWLSILMGAFTVAAAFLLAHQIFSDNLLALTAAAFTAFNAMYLFVTSSVNNDALVIPLAALALWLMVRFIAGRPSMVQWFGLGVILGLACLTKTSALALLPVAALSAVVVAYRHRSIDDFVYAGIALLVPVLAIGGWWYWRNWRLYRDPLGLNAFLSIVGPRYPIPTLAQLAGEWKGFVMSYWGFFGGMNVPAPGWYYWAMSLLALIGLAGAPLYIWQQARQHTLTAQKWWQLGLTLIFPAGVLIALIRWTLLTIASQGRLMFPAITALSLWMAMGWCSLLRSRLRFLPPLLVAGFMAVTAALMPFIVIRPAYALPVITSQPIEVYPQYNLDINFDNRIRLLGYDLEQTQIVPGEPASVTLYWRALAEMDADYTVFVHLVSQDGLIVGQRDRYPGQGTYPTRLWKPGDILSDTFVVLSSAALLTPNQISIATGFYQLADGSRLSILDERGVSVGDAAHFASLEVPSRSVDGIPNPLSVDFGGRIALVGYQLDRTSIKAGETLHLTLYWRALTDMDENYTVFIQLLADDQRKLAQIDSWPQGGQAPTTTWQKGQLVKDSYDLEVASDADPQIAQLEIGLYDSAVQRLAVLGHGGHVQDTRLVLGKIRIE